MKCVCGATVAQPTPARPKVRCRRCHTLYRVMAPAEMGGPHNPTGVGGAKGGRQRARNLTPERRKEIAARAAQARWGSR